MTKKLDLAAFCGEFCTERTHPRMAELKTHAEKSIRDGLPMSVDRSRVKLLGVSFIDEWLSDLALRFGKEVIFKSIIFRPALDPIHLAQIDRGIRMRKPQVP